MADEIKIYISAAPELSRERELLGQLIAEIPVSLGWLINQSPTRSEPVDIEAVRSADIHLLVLGSDIRAPIGYEWLIAKRSRLPTWLILKKDILQTQAARDFVRQVGLHAEWMRYKDSSDLRRMVERLIAEHILTRTSHYNIQGEELEKLLEWQKDLEVKAETLIDETMRGAGESAVIISPERFTPRDGVLLKPPQDDFQEG